MALIDRAHECDERGAVEIFNRYTVRLIELARSRLRSKVVPRLDAEDIVQSAYRSFFRRLGSGHYQVTEVDQLWQLLATITVNKVHKATRRHMARKRSVLAEKSISADSVLTSVSLAAMSREPSPHDAAVLLEETEWVMSRLTALQRQILQMRLQEFTVDQVACQIKCSHRTVYRALEAARSELEKRILADNGD